MRWSRCLIPTLKEIPSDAEIPSNILMLRAGLIRKLSSGIYTLLFLGLRSARRVEQIVREEMNRIGGIEILMPILSPAELWMESGRWNVYGKELMRVRDRNDRFFALGPTHEEVVTDLVRHEIRSYRRLPLILYQIQTKFRDEHRPRFGVMRAREFIMKDAYSFHRDEASLDQTYQDMYQAYTRVFKRCGLGFEAVMADSGAIGGDVTHEFTVFAETGESLVLSCQCGYAATSDIAEGIPEQHVFHQDPLPMEKVSTPNMKTVEEVTAFLGKQPWQLVKTILYKADQGFVGVLIRGDRQINEVKLNRMLGTPEFRMATPEEIESLTGAPLGFTGPVGLSGIRLIADKSIRGMRNFVTGANHPDAHYINVNIGRDFDVEGYYDLAEARALDGCIRCGKDLSAWRGIEVGQIFKLGTKYSKSMKANFLDEDGTEKPFVMGCYGIGITRTVAAAIEQNNDKDGISWPIAIAPFEALVMPTNVSDVRIRETSEKIYLDLIHRGVDAIIDDRDERPGNKFKDADLIGIPVRVTVGERGIERGIVEVRLRRTGETVAIPISEAVSAVLDIIAKEKSRILS
ncbi:MAG: proline--tRNA ligase [bacterium]